jgi:hypothetical protein
MGQTFQLEPAGHGRHLEPESVLLSGFQAELDDMRAKVADFPNRDPDEVLLFISGLAGRLAEIRALLYRANTQRASALRTREVDPLREDLELQFKLWSRRIALMEWELRVAGGAP